MYGLTVTVISLVIATARPAVRERLVQDSSTNLENLHDHPALVLLVSAFVEPSLPELFLVVPLVACCVLLQRWLGRAAAVVVLTLGHVGATLLVATFLTSELTHGAISRSVTRAPDVGFSYALVTALGVLSARVPARWSPWYTGVLTALFLMMLVVSQTFTDLGHLTAWSLGLGLAVLIRGAGPGLRRRS